MNASVSSKCHVHRYLLLSYWALDLSQLCTGRQICDDENRSITDRVLDLNTSLCQTDGQHTNRVEGSVCTSNQGTTLVEDTPGK